MECEDPVYKGFLLVPPVGKILLKKSWQRKYCLLYKLSKYGKERLEIYDSAEAKSSNQTKIITLEDVIKISRKSPTNFSILTRSGECEFGGITEQSMNEWVSAIQSIVFPDEVSRVTSIEEDNELYCPSGEGVFNVRLCHSPASRRCDLESKNYSLVLTSTAIQLRNIADNKLLYTWPYRSIRRYGYKEGKFTFEAGRMCESGEGTFYFLEHTGQEIFRCLASKMSSMKKLLNGESTGSILECGEVHLHAALSMEARSRSPLPPSPTTVNIQDSNFSNKSNSVASDIDIWQNIHQKTPLKMQPIKPPRKVILPKENTKPVIDMTYEPIDKYDHVEYRSEAWKTMGLDNVNHTETSNDSVQNLSWGEVKKECEKISIRLPEKTFASAVITESMTDLDDASYDKLNFFGSTSKLNINSGYKQVFPSPVSCMPSTPSFNTYDEVQCIESARPADDSHLGYALIRKETSRGPIKEITLRQDDSARINHQMHNNEPYAVISKPKRV